MEHVPRPERCIAEAHRLLKSGGVFIGSIPFRYPVHRDPVDLVRIGPDGLERLLADFDDVNIYSMGNFFGVLGLFLESKVSSVRLGRIMTAVAIPKILKAMLLLTGNVLTYLDRNPVSINKNTTLFTTGYFFICTSDNLRTFVPESRHLASHERAVVVDIARNYYPALTGQ